MSSSQPRVGADIESECGKCGRETWHVVLAMVGTQVVKVQCKGCGAQHKLKRPGGPAARGRAGGTTKKKAAPRERLPEGPTVQSDLSRAVRPYSVTTLYQVADRVQHPIFGTGVVELTEPGKITVYFPAGRRVLAQARQEAQLERPRRLPREE